MRKLYLICLVAALISGTMPALANAVSPSGRYCSGVVLAGDDTSSEEEVVVEEEEEPDCD